MNLPHLLLDVDGVLIPFPDHRGQGPASHLRHLVAPTDHDPVPIWLNPQHGTLINNVLSRGLLHPVWCTSWRHDANTHIGPKINLPPFDVLDLPRLNITTSHPHGHLWKRDHVNTWAGADPIAWIDDDFTPLDHQWAADRTIQVAPTLLIQPDPTIGLLPAHLDHVQTWATTVRSSEPTPLAHSR
jgi:hypothetical protein